MRKEFLMDTIGQAKDTYVMEAGMEVKTKRTGKRFWKVLAAAALIPALVLTAYATDFLNIKALLLAFHYACCARALLFIE